MENAIRHGIYEKGRKGGNVTIHTGQKEDSWVIRVQDDGVGFDVGLFMEEMKKSDIESTGIRNIEFRLRHVMGASVDIQSIKNIGTSVTINLPKEGKRNESNNR